MIKLEPNKMQKAIERARAIRPRVTVINASERLYSVSSSRKAHLGQVFYTVRFVVVNGMKLAECDCAAGQLAFEATLPDYFKRQVETEDSTPIGVNLTLTDERQRELCLSCPLADCVDVTDPRCPIRIEQRRLWREQNRRRADG